MSEILSYVAGTSDVPLCYETVYGAFCRTVARYPDHEALVSSDQQTRFTYAAFKERCDALAASLVAIGLKPGDRLGILSPNRWEWVATQMATAKIGVILVNINPAYRRSELLYALNKSGCAALIMAQRFKSTDYIELVDQAIQNIGPSGRVSDPDLPLLHTIVTIGDGDGSDTFLGFNQLIEMATDDARTKAENHAARCQPEEPINIQFTSGTTGLPKGATLSHLNIQNNGFFVGRRLALNASDRLALPVPLYHCFGMVLGVLACFSHGACVVLTGEAFDPDKVLATVAQEKCTALYGVPTMFIEELNSPTAKSADVSSLRTGMMAGSPCPTEIMKAVIERLNMRDVTIGYGMTETSPVSFQTMPSDAIEKRVATVGLVHPFVEAKIVDDDGRVVPRGAQGEILVRGYLVMQGYWDDKERTEEAIDAAGWMRTGDLGVIDEQRYLKITGRVKDMIIRGGENIYPREIEEYLYRHPGVRDVQVFGVPDDKLGEAVCAWIQSNDPSLAEDGIVDFCRGEIAHYKIPKYIRFVDDFPMTVTGKAQKFAMREAMVKELGKTPDDRSS